MEGTYQEILAFMRTSGKRLLTKTGNIQDIGVTKQFLTEEDLAIERGFKAIIKKLGPDHSLYAEEEHDLLQQTHHIWAVDPISGTATFIKGSPHYAIVISHVFKNDVQFAAVYDPSVDELFTARKGQGAYLNEKRIHVVDHSNTYVLFKVPPIEKQSEKAKGVLLQLFEHYKLRITMHSIAVDYCSIACGRFDGMISFTKDVFPEYAGSLIVREAGGIFTNDKGESSFAETDRVFLAGNKETYNKLHAVLTNI